MTLAGVGACEKGFSEGFTRVKRLPGLSEKAGFSLNMCILCSLY